MTLRRHPHFASRPAQRSTDSPRSDQIDPPTLPCMKVRVDSDEYRAWHEVGHATVCLHLGGDVEFIEFLDGDARGYARTRCDVEPDNSRSVACGGFAAEFYILDKGYAEQDSDDERNISQVVFHNATDDREDFWQRKLGRDEAFTEAEDREFMNHAIGFVAPIFDQYFSRMQEVVRELCEARRVEGWRVMNSCGSAIPVETDLGERPLLADSVSRGPRRKAALGPAARPVATSIRGNEYGPVKVHRCRPST